MKIKKHIVFLLVVLLAACAKVEDVTIPVSQCASIPVGCASACACSLNGKGYVFGGRDKNGTYLNDLWQYDPQTDSWLKIPTPLKPRVNASVIAYNGALYMGLGYARGSIYDRKNNLQDWWRWNPTTNKWDSLAAYPNKTTNEATTFVVNDRIYAIYGASDGFSREIHYYEPKNNTWTSVPDNYHRALSSFGGVGAMYQGKTYFGLGFNIHPITQWYTMDLPSDKWTKLGGMPGKGRSFSACGVGNRYIYVFGGRYFAGEYTGGEVFADIWRYDPEDDNWARAGLMPCGKAENLIAFAVNGKVYFGLGEDENGTILNTLYRIED